MHSEEREPHNDDITKNIDKLRKEFIEFEKKQIVKERVFQQEIDNKMLRKKTINKNTEFATVFTGWLVPLIKSPLSKFKGALNTYLKARVIDVLGSEHNLVNGPEIRTVKRITEKKITNSKLGKYNFKNMMADLSGIKPNYGVTVRMNNNVKKGPTVSNDPELSSRIFPNIHNVKEFYKTEISYFKNEEEDENKLKTENINSLVIDDLMVSGNYRNKKLFSALPSDTFTSAKRHKSDAKESTLEKVMVNKELIEKALDMTNSNFYHSHEKSESVTRKGISTGHNSILTNQGRRIISPSPIHKKYRRPFITTKR